LAEIGGILLTLILTPLVGWQYGVTLSPVWLSIGIIGGIPTASIVLAAMLPKGSHLTIREA